MNAGTLIGTLLVGIAATAFMLSGCISIDAETIKALVASERSWCLSITSIYGTARVGGTGLNNGRAICNQEGMNINATPSPTP
jgi:hypothetical protein